LKEIKHDLVSPFHLGFDPDGTRLAIVSASGRGLIATLGAHAPLTSLSGHAGAINSISFSPDGRRAVTASDDHTVREWNADTGACLLVYRGHTGPVVRATFLLTASG
jgi:WD40 repeat protein